MKILVTGGLGYIGSHTSIELINNDHVITIVDNLCNSSLAALDQIEKITGCRPKLFQIDVTEEKPLEKVFQEDNFDGVIHFAGLKAVGESVEKPLDYYYNNLTSTMRLSKMCLKYGVGRFVFSSSATVYGENAVPFVENMPLLPRMSPYGETKAMSERILTDVAAANPGFGVTLLRYFNPVGAHESGLIGENPNGIPNNLMPYVTKVAKGSLPKLRIYGNDYPTEDGTGIRDYIHVMDLAEGHVAAIEKPESGVNIYNLGTGRGTSVLELIHAFVEVNGVEVPYEIVGRRPGDIAAFYADVSKAERELGWRAKRGLRDMVRDAWRFEQNQVHHHMKEINSR